MNSFSIRPFIVPTTFGEPDLALRDSLTVLAILLICLLTAALVVPYLVDFNSHRGFIEAKLSRAAGTRIAIGGPIRIRLLPQPSFRLADVTVGDVAPGQPSLHVAELDVDIALTALMRGDLQVGEAVLRAPRLDIAIAADGAPNLRLPGLGDPSRVQFDHVVVADGTLTVTQPGHPTLTLAGLDFYGEAASLIGPFKITGQFGPAEDRQDFRLATGVFESGKMRLKLAFDATKARPSLDLDGVMTPGGGTAQKPIGPRLDGLLTLKGQVPLSDNPATVPWMLTGHVQANRETVSAADIEVRAGTDMRAINATGTGEMVLGPDPHATLRLHGPQLNVDALAVPADKSPVPPPTGAAFLSALNGKLGQDGAPRLPLKLDVDYAFDTVTAGRLTVLGIAGQVGFDGTKATRITMTARGPEAATLALDGRFEAGMAPVFRGRLDASLRDLPRFAAWLAPLLPETARSSLAAIPAHALSFGGDVDLSGVGIAARGATLRLDTSQFAGTLTYTGAVGGDRARLFADLASEGIDLDDLPDLSAASGGWSDLDLDLALTARALKFVPAGVGAVDAGRLGLRLHKTGDDAVLDSFSADLGSASLTATGGFDRQSARLDARVDAPMLDAVADLLAHLLPGTPTAWLRDRAPALSPTRVDLGLRATRTADGSLLPISLVLDGIANGSRVKATLKPDVPGDLDPQNAVISADLVADTPQGFTLLRQLGVPTVAAGAADSLPAMGPGRIKGRAHGSAAEGFEMAVDAALGGAVLSFQGRSKTDHGSGHLSLKGNDLAPLLRSAGLVAGGAAEAWPADGEADLSWHDGNLAFRHMRGRAGPSSLTGDLTVALGTPAPGRLDAPVLFGAVAFDRFSVPAMLNVALGPAPVEGTEPWSNRPFGPPLLQWPRSEIVIKTKALDLMDGVEAAEASLTLRADRRAVTLADLTGTLHSGRLGGSLTMRRDGPNASISGTASWSGIPVDWPGLAGRIGGTMDFGGSGGSPAALVAGLAGTGSVTIADGLVARFDPAALSRTAVKAEMNTSDVDAGEITDLVVPELDRGPLRLGDVAGQALLTSGVFRVGPLRAATADWTADGDGALDLRDFSFSSKTVLRVRQPLPDWRGEAPQLTLQLDGPIDAPVREIDAAAFVNALQSRAIARDQERIDTIQQDIRERAFFNRRLKSIEAEQAAAREQAEAEAEILRRTRQSQEAPPRVTPPIPIARPAPRASTSPGLRAPNPASPPAGRTNRSGGVRPSSPPATLPDPASAGPF